MPAERRKLQFSLTTAKRRRIENPRDSAVPDNESDQRQFSAIFKCPGCMESLCTRKCCDCNKTCLDFESPDEVEDNHCKFCQQYSCDICGSRSDNGK